MTSFPHNTAPMIREGVGTVSLYLSVPPSLSHSRIEWVWLHWSEYLLAQDEFYRWFQRMVVILEPPVELQLGLKEKQWQLSHAQVLLHNVDNQAVLLDRLLEEAGSLFNRIGDPSVDEDAQKRMKAEYDAVKARAQVSRGWLHHPSTSPSRMPSHPICPLLLVYHLPILSLATHRHLPNFRSTSWPVCSIPRGITKPPFHTLPSISPPTLLSLLPISHQSPAPRLTSLFISSTTGPSAPPVYSPIKPPSHVLIISICFLAHHLIVYSPTSLSCSSIQRLVTYPPALHPPVHPAFRPLSTSHRCSGLHALVDAQ